ncbi:protein-disulfide reductase DsbD family protein [Devosia sp. YIM 151766]|uniref:protein-disulfide reductase DsbD domain-containing protein n=1 Tax=Devosia sp. YIM 151766 TaxID=3017325 RepID=UPI00255C5DCA|nr:protein-disulfide reductase DsbD domain-containing protein [Devosia sp. YIM 151766]WIY53491.1 protein-disulfide reductase DsbD family protein [Devosia sp. YIM 151766]
MRLISVLCLAISFLCPAALAAETPWQSLAPGVSIRLIGTGQVADDGKTLVALEIDMPDSTKTYWRVPGETGLPVDLDFSDSVGVVAHRQFWPYPLREEKAEKTDYVYYGHTVLPIELTMSDPDGTVDILATLGICSEICVPARTRLRLPLTAGPPDAPNGLRIRQAMAAVPISWTDEPHPIGRVSLMAGATAIGIRLEQDGVDAASLIAATSSGEPLFGAPQKSPHGDLVVLPILGKSDNSALDGLEVEITFMTEMGAYVVSRTVEAGDAANETALGQ